MKLRGLFLFLLLAALAQGMYAQVPAQRPTIDIRVVFPPNNNMLVIRVPDPKIQLTKNGNETYNKSRYVDPEKELTERMPTFGPLGQALLKTGKFQTILITNAADKYGERGIILEPVDISVRIGQGTRLLEQIETVKRSIGAAYNADVREIFPRLQEVSEDNWVHLPQRVGGVTLAGFMPVEVAPDHDGLIHLQPYWLRDDLLSLGVENSFYVSLTAEEREFERDEIYRWNCPPAVRILFEEFPEVAKISLWPGQLSLEFAKDQAKGQQSGIIDKAAALIAPIIPIKLVMK